MATEGTKIDLEKLRSIGVISRRGDARIREYRDPDDNHRIKKTTTELGSTIEHNTPDDRVDAIVTPETVRVHVSDIKIADGE